MVGEWYQPCSLTLPSTIVASPSPPGGEKGESKQAVLKQTLEWAPPGVTWGESSSSPASSVGA